MKTIVFGAVLSAFALSAHAQVKISDAWIRATVPQQPATGAFMQITSQKAARLIAATSPLAESVELHEMKLENNVMKMRQISAIDLPSGKAVDLRPGNLHIMLQGLKQQVREGDIVPLTLIVETPDKKRESIPLQVPARPLTAPSTSSAPSAPATGGHGAR